MMFKNSAKLLFANFANVWKLLLYYIIVTLIGVGLVAPVFASIGDVLGHSEFVDVFSDILTTFNLGTNVISIFATFASLIKITISCIANYFVAYTGYAIYLTVVFVIILPFLYGLSSIPTGEALYGYMSSQTKINFAGKIFGSFKRSIKYLLSKILIITPINCLIVAGCAASFELINLTGTVRLISPLFITTIICILISVRIILFSGWLPALIVYDCGVFSALKRGFEATFRRFFKSLSTMFVMVLLSICLDILFGSYALILLLPTEIFFIVVFCFVMFYGSQGMRYYVDADTIITPKKLEEVDKFSRCKDLI